MVNAKQAAEFAEVHLDLNSNMIAKLDEQKLDTKQSIVYMNDKNKERDKSLKNFLQRN